jgi:acyl-CoA ligase (AMP-forming) (exosortase A-associated)
MRSQLHHLVTEAAANAPDDAALTYRERILSYQQLAEEVAHVARRLTGLGLVRGQRVAVFLDKRVETVSAMFATSAAGGVVVPVNPLLRPRQVAYVLADCDVRVLVTTPERLDQLRDELDGCKALGDVLLVPGPRASRGDSTAPAAPAYRVSWWSADPADPGDSSAPADLPVPADPVGAVDTDMAAIFYTSGSTGSPKGVVLSHRNLLVGAESVSHYLRNGADDVILSALPLSFDAGFSQLTTAFAVGAHVVLHNHLLPGDVVRLCAAHRVTGLTGVPPLWIQLAEQTWPPEASRHLRYFANTGGRMPRATLDRLRAVFPQARPFLMYGLTEAFRSTYLDPAEVDRRPDSIGQAIPNAEVLVVRADGTPCAPGEEGELVHRGPLVGMGYWNDPERTAERFRPAPGRDPGLCTPEIAVWSGDVVVRDDEGFLYFVGRRDDMIKTSGYRVSPTEVEEAAYDTGLVRDAVALGVPDVQLGQRIVLVTTAAGDALDERELLDRLRGALPRYMVPSLIEVRTDLPRSPNGKFDRTRLRAEVSG